MKTFRKISPRRFRKLLSNYSRLISKQDRFIGTMYLQIGDYRSRICELERIIKLYKYCSLSFGVLGFILGFIGLIFQFV